MLCWNNGNSRLLFLAKKSRGGMFVVRWTRYIRRHLAIGVKNLVIWKFRFGFGPLLDRETFVVRTRLVVFLPTNLVRKNVRLRGTFGRLGEFRKDTRMWWIRGALITRIRSSIVLRRMARWYGGTLFFRPLRLIRWFTFRTWGK